MKVVSKKMAVVALRVMLRGMGVAEEDLRCCNTVSNRQEREGQRLYI
jgi:hypothetical protein